jgi:hypothetical protein
LTLEIPFIESRSRYWNIVVPTTVGIHPGNWEQWNDPLNWHIGDGHTLRERNHRWREESDIPGSFSAWP